MRFKNSEFGKWEHKGINLKKMNFKDHLKKRKGMGYKLAEMAKKYFKTPFILMLLTMRREKGHGSKGEHESSVF